MSAPAALCFSKLMYPETEEIKITKDNVDVIESCVPMIQTKLN